LISLKCIMNNNPPPNSPQTPTEMSAHKLKIIRAKPKVKPQIKWVKIKHVKTLIEKKSAIKKNKLNKQLLEKFPEFQQFKVEIRNIPEWCLDWEDLSTK